VKISPFFPGIAIDETDDYAHPVRAPGNFMQSVKIRFDKAVQTQQVARRVAGQAELRESHQIGAE